MLREVLADKHRDQHSPYSGKALKTDHCLHGLRDGAGVTYHETDMDQAVVRSAVLERDSLAAKLALKATRVGDVDPNAAVDGAGGIVAEATPGSERITIGVGGREVGWGDGRGIGGGRLNEHAEDGEDREDGEGKHLGRKRCL